MIKNSKGFTLVEALVVITVIGFIGVILTDLLFRSFRSSNKTQIQGILQESGQSALNVMDQSIRFSRIVCVEPGDGTGSIIAVRTRDARIIRFMMTYQTDICRAPAWRRIAAIPTGPESPVPPGTQGKGCPASDVAQARDRA